MCDVGEGGIFVEKGFSIIERKHLFYLICIFLRLMIAGIVYNFSDNKKLQYLLLIISLSSVYLNYIKINECVWWSRKFHFVIALLLFIITLLIITKQIKTDKWMSYLLYIDIIWGIIHSLVVQPFV